MLLCTTCSTLRPVQYNNSIQFTGCADSIIVFEKEDWAIVTWRNQQFNETTSVYERNRRTGIFESSVETAVQIYETDPPYITFTHPQWTEWYKVLPYEEDVVEINSGQYGLRLDYRRIINVLMMPETFDSSGPITEHKEYQDSVWADVLLGAAGGALVFAGSEAGVNQFEEDVSGGLVLAGALLGTISYPLYKWFTRGEKLEPVDSFQSARQAGILYTWKPNHAGWCLNTNHSL